MSTKRRNRHTPGADSQEAAGYRFVIGQSDAETRELKKLVSQW